MQVTLPERFPSAQVLCAATSCAKDRSKYTFSVWYTPKYAEKSGLSALPSVDFADFAAVIEGIVGGGSRQVVGSHVFQDFAPGNGRARITGLRSF